MAYVILNPIINSLSGRIGNLVFYSSDGREYARSYVKPRNPDTPAQRANRGLFRNAMKAWQALSAFDRAAYNRRAGRLGMTGHNLYIRKYMLAHANTGSSERTAHSSRGDVPARCRPSSSFHVPGHSVSPFIPRPDTPRAPLTPLFPVLHDGG
jgi:hypothetical protein